jgi:hypothetical protein
LFSVINPAGQHWSFELDTVGAPLRYTAMASLLTAAYSGNKTIMINTTPNPGGVAYASEIQVVRESK